MIHHIHAKAHIHCPKRHAHHVLALIHCTSWGNQEKKRNCFCQFDSSQMTSIRWSSSHHRVVRCPLSLLLLSGPCHHTDGGSQLSSNRHGRRDIGVCMWSHVQSSPWQIWWGIGAWLNLWPILILLKYSSLPLPFWLPLLFSLLLIFSVLLAFSSPLPSQLPPSSSFHLLFLARLTAKLIPIGQLFPWGLLSPNEPLGLAW